MSPKKLCPLLRVVVIAALPTLALARLEPVTQIFFPDERAGQPLVGVGARELGKQLQSNLSFSTRFLRVRTWWSRAPDPQLQMYAVGLYAHRIGLQLALLKLKGEERAASELPPGFFEAVCGGFAKTIVIKMACSMSREQIAGEFVESVQQRMGSGGSKELEALQEIIQKGCVAFAAEGYASAGTEFAFGLRGPSIGVSVNGKGAGSLSSYRLSHAILASYFDEQAVSPAFKQSCGEGFIALL